MSSKGLGKGLSALFSSTEDDYKKTFGVTDEDIKSGVLELELKDVYPNPSQPRKVFEPQALNELASSNDLSELQPANTKSWKCSMLSGTSKYSNEEHPSNNLDGK